MTLGKVFAPQLVCDYRTPEGKRTCARVFGGERLREPIAEFRSRAGADGWVRGTCRPLEESASRQEVRPMSWLPKTAWLDP